MHANSKIYFKTSQPYALVMEDIDKIQQLLDDQCIGIINLTQLKYGYPRQTLFAVKTISKIEQVI